MTLSVLLGELYGAHSAGVVETGKGFAPPVCDVHLPLTLDPDHMRICITSLLFNAILRGGDEIRPHVGVPDEGRWRFRCMTRAPSTRMWRWRSRTSISSWAADSNGDRPKGAWPLPAADPQA